MTGFGKLLGYRLRFEVVFRAFFRVITTLALALSLWAPAGGTGNCYAELPLTAGQSFRWDFTLNTRAGRGGAVPSTSLDVSGINSSECTLRVDLFPYSSPSEPFYSQTFVNPPQGRATIRLDGALWGGPGGAADVTVLSGSSR